MSPARLAAYRALRAVTNGAADAPRALERARARLRDPRDRALVTEIVLGTLRWQAAVDHLITTFAGRPAARLDSEVLDVLRLTAFQVVYLERVPAAAAVSDAVELTRQIGKSSAAGFVNAVLRRFERERPLPLPPEPGPGADRASVLDYASITLSHPRWLAERWLARYGAAALVSWTRFNNHPAPITVRANRLKTTRDQLAASLAAAGVTAEPTRYAPHGLVVTAGNPLRTPLATSGLLFVQDEASQLVAALAAVQPGERVLDLCAAPGGKTTAFAADMKDEGLVVACDVRPRRLALLGQTIAVSGASVVRIARVDVLADLPFRPVFDCVVLDAPCSGLGTLRRDPEIRWRRTEADLARLAAAQRRMLAHAAAAVRPGGRLLYATCSSEPDENEEVVAAFLARHPAFARARAAPTVAAVVNGAGDLRTLPHAHGLEAFYGCLIVRR